MGLEHELRLLLAIAMNAAVLAGAWRFVSRRVGGELVGRVVDAGLLYYLVQYAIVGAFGIAGVLSLTSIAIAAIIVAAGLWFAAGPWRPEVRADDPRQGRLVLWASFLFVAGYAAAIIHNQRYLPPQANDALTYHLPAAVQWLQTGRVGLYETWFYNPANTYSPLAGSMFIAWLIAPVHNDVLARFVEAGPLLLIFWVMVDIGRRAGASITVASLVAAAASLSRPMLSQVNLAKDDLFVAAFFLIAVSSLLRPAGERRWAAWRCGIAAGLMLATKYTALFSVPLLVLMADAPWQMSRWRWREILVAKGAAIVLAGPWFVRNIILTGNPLYPTNVSIGGWKVFDGMLTALPSDRLDGWRWWGALTGGYYGLPVVLTLGLAALWLMQPANFRKQILGSPLHRVLLLGPPIGIGLFVLGSPYAEIRFVYPSLLVLWLGAAGVLGWIGRWGVVVAAVMAALSALTAFGWGAGTRPQMLGFVTVAAIVAGLGAAVVAMLPRLPRSYRIAGGVAAVLVAAMPIYTHWRGYLQVYRQGIDEIVFPGGAYGELGETWAYIRTSLPPRATLAYTNTYLIHPLFGFDLDRPVSYAPTQPGVRALHDLPDFEQPTTGERIPLQVAPQTWHNADRQTWLDNLDRLGAQYVLIGKRSIADLDLPADPPELGFARSMPQRFQLIRDNSAAALYRVVGH